MGNRSQCQNMSSGSTCLADCISTQCVRGGPVAFRCPPLNIDPNRHPDLIGGRCFVGCRPCAVGGFIDMDDTQGIATGTMLIGPVRDGSSLNVSGVRGYRLFFTDSCYRQLGDVIEFVNQTTMVYGCCVGNAFEVTLVEVSVPRGAAFIM